MRWSRLLRTFVHQMEKVADAIGLSTVKPLKDGEAEIEAEHVDTLSDSDHIAFDVPSDLKAIGLLELFGIDERPVLIFDLESLSKTTPVYYNARMRALHNGAGLPGKECEAISNVSAEGEDSAFTKWAISQPIGGITRTARYNGIRWTNQTLRGRWRILTGEAIRKSLDLDPFQSQDRSEVNQNNASIPQAATLLVPACVNPNLVAFTLHRDDTISLLPKTQETELRTNSANAPSSPGSGDVISGSRLSESAHVKFFQNFDWADTELGPIDSWSPELRSMANLLLADPRPAALFWGQNSVMLYNEAYKLVTGQKHSSMMGKPIALVWAELAGDFAPAFEKIYETGMASTMDDALICIDRHGYLEETYYSMSIIPLGSFEIYQAFYNPFFETTRQVIAERRMAFLLRVGQFIASSRDPKDFWQQLLLAIAPNHPDIPFALLYSGGGEASEELSVASEQSQTPSSWFLEGAVRVTGSNQGIPSRLDSAVDVEEFLPSFTKMIRSDLHTILKLEDGSLSPRIAEAIEKSNQSRLCDTAVFIPVRPQGENTLGFLIIGINPRKCFDEDYNLFVLLLSRQLATSVAAACMFEEDTRQARMAAEMTVQDRNGLSKKLAIQIHETFEADNRFRRMADMAPVGMFHLDPDGLVLYANEYWYDLTQSQRDGSSSMSLYDSVLDEDQAIMLQEWGKLLGGEPSTFEIRLKRFFHPPKVLGSKNASGPSWVILAAHPEKTKDGTVVGILGCSTDISKQKWAEGVHKSKMLEAVELKRQQENFIDMTSHEMRNPLSAITQCADTICITLTEFSTDEKDPIIPREAIETSIDASQTVILCAQHQKRIIDDILTLSKIDSNILFVTPVEVQPALAIESALKMFDGELRKADVDLRFRVEQSYIDLDIDWVMLDPSRMLQVFINLVTNAIKFTEPEPKRQIFVNIGASLSLPESRHGIEYLPRATPPKGLISDAEWGTGEEVYISISVQDAGRGLTDQERKLLFQRFSQASKRTHVQYGGSGLGLYISRTLTELQGGQIGVASKAGIGSTFAFYLKARRCTKPANLTTAEARHIEIRTQTKRLSNLALARVNDVPNIERPASLPPQSQNHILIVEDNIVNQKVLSKQLRNAGCIVYLANHGLEALTFLSTTRFYKGNEDDGVQLSIILMDLEMPTMDSLTCVERIRKLQVEGVLVGHVPVIAVTANARSEQIAKAKECGMDCVVTKPFRMKELMPEMERLIRRGIDRVDGVETREGFESSVSAPV